MGQLDVRFQVMVMTTTKARYKHLVSDGGQRSWCDKVDARKAKETVPLRPDSGEAPAAGWQDEICPKCMHYLTWIERNAESDFAKS